MQAPLGSQDLHEETLVLDLWQMEGSERALSLPPCGFLAVEGPPGTGKTSVTAAAACDGRRQGAHNVAYKRGR